MPDKCCGLDASWCVNHRKGRICTCCCSDAGGCGYRSICGADVLSCQPKWMFKA